jgi:hypothetical protein
MAIGAGLEKLKTPAWAGLAAKAKATAAAVPDAIANGAVLVSKFTVVIAPH